MKEEIARALQKKQLAREAREDQDLDGAIKLIDEATGQLERLWQEKGAAIDERGESASPEERELVEAMAETYGVKGGIYRSAGKPEEAVKAYDRGYYFEQHAARKVDNSYNLVQRLINRVLLEPALLGAPDWNVLGKDMWTELSEANGKLERQIGTTRANDPWAYADMIMVHILLTARGSESGEDAVERALQEFEKLKPKPFVYDSSLQALSDVQNFLQRVPTEARLEGWKVVVRALEYVTSRLTKGFAMAKTR